MMFSTHFKRTLAAIAAIIALLLGAYMWMKVRIHDVLLPPRVVLSANDKELVSFDANRHTVTVTTDKGTTHQYSRDGTVEIRKDGTVKVDAHAWGTELRPFLGLGYSDTGRAYVGCQLFYWHQFDAGASFGWTADNRKNAFQPMLSLGWNFYSNTSLNLGINPLTIAGLSKPEPAIFLSVRL